VDRTARSARERRAAGAPWSFTEPRTAPRDALG